MAETEIMMTAWRRPQYLRKVLQSWSQVRGIRDVPIKVFLEPSDRQGQMLELIYEAQDWGVLDIGVHENPERLGVLVNPVESAGRMFRENTDLQYLIFAEEDLIVSNDVLEYFRWADKEFRDREDVLIACAHTTEGAKKEASPEEVHLGTRFRCWIWSTWRDRWEKVLEPTWDRNYGSAQHERDGAGWDYNIDSRIIPRGDYKTVLPAASRSQNIGKFEGVHADPSTYVHTLNPSFQPVREPVSYRLSG